MYNFQQSNLRIGVAYTRRDLWINSQTQKKKMRLLVKYHQFLKKIL